MPKPTTETRSWAPAVGLAAPPKRELARLLGVSCAHLRTGLAIVVREKQRWRHVGKGTFIGPRPPTIVDLSELARRTNPLQVMRARFAVENYLVGWTS